MPPLLPAYVALATQYASDVADPVQLYLDKYYSVTSVKSFMAAEELTNHYNSQRPGAAALTTQQFVVHARDAAGWPNTVKRSWGQPRPMGWMGLVRKAVEEEGGVAAPVPVFQF